MRRNKLMSERKRKICELDAESIAFYRRNPCIACEDLLGIRLIDSQKYILQQSWNKPHVLWCCSRNFGKSFLGAIFMVLKAILYENQAIYIVSSVGDQSKETFTKIEEIVLRIGKTSASIRSLKDIVEKETKKSSNNKTGFGHAQSGFHVEFYNGSEIFTLNGNPDNNRSKFEIYMFIIENKSKRRKLIMNPRWGKKEIEYLKHNYYSTSLEEMSSFLNRDASAIKVKACKLKITSNKEWTKDEIEYLKNNYQIKTYKELCQGLKGRSKAAIDLKINRLGLSKSKYTYNHDFFENIDTEEKAYWLGFMYADGCVNMQKNNSAEVCIKLYAGDSNHLKKFNKSLKGNIPVNFDERVCSFNNKIQYSCSIRCYSIKMAKDLISHGCTPHKTFTIDMPKMDATLIHHFIRGFFDGDGCICTVSNERKTLGINFCSASQQFLSEIRTVLFRNGINSYITDEKDKTTYRLYVKGLKNVDNMWNYMFNDASIYLDRKYTKKEKLYEEYKIAQRLLRQSEMVG